jgi:predicted transcriptional regulator
LKFFLRIYWERGVFLINKGEGRRSNLDIIADILDASRRGINKTRLMQNSSMSFMQLQKYLDLILNARLIFVESDGSRFLFKISGKGRSFLEAYESLKALMKQA